MIQKGTFPVRGKIDFELNNAQLGMLEKRLINSFPMDAIVSYPDQPLLGKRKLKLNILFAHSPGSVLTKTTGVRNGSNAFSQSASNGIARSHEYLMNSIIGPNSWILFGTVQAEKPISIVICFYVQFNFGTFAFKDESETEKEFNPQNN